MVKGNQHLPVTIVLTSNELSLPVEQALLAELIGKLLVKPLSQWLSVFGVMAKPVEGEHKKSVAASSCWVAVSLPGNLANTDKMSAANLLFGSLRPKLTAVSFGRGT
jgi:hypothetical protein